MRFELRIVAAIGFIVVGTAVEAQQTTGVIRGIVTSLDGSPLAGVKASIMGSDDGLERSVLSDNAGRFLAAALPKGRYRVTLSRDGFRTAVRTVGLLLDHAATLSIEMTAGDSADVDELDAAPHQLFVTDTLTGMSFALDEMFSSLPLVHDTQLLALLAPTAVAGVAAYHGTPYYTYGQDSVAVGGASVVESSVRLNGLNLSNFRTGNGSSWVPHNAVDQLQVIGGGWDASLGRTTGAVVDMVSKRGSNSLHGEASVFFLPANLQENEPDTPQALNQQEEHEMLDAYLSLGGPIVRDRLFAFGFLQYRDTDLLRNTTTTATRERGGEPYSGGRLDWSITPEHRVEISYLNDATSIKQWEYPIVDGLPVEDEAMRSGTIERGGDNLVGRYAGMLTDRLAVSAQYGFNEFERSFRGAGDGYPYAVTYATGSFERIPGSTTNLIGRAGDKREAARAEVALFLGDHSLAAGIDWEHNRSEELTTYSGGYRISYYLNRDPVSGRLLFPDLADDQLIADYRIYESGGDFDVLSTAAYVQDSWQPTPRLTIDLGLRWERFENRNVDHEAFVTIDDQIAPRLGVAWDPAGDGRSKLYGSGGRYHLPIPSNTNIRLSGREYYVGDWFTVDGFGPHGEPVNLGSEPLADQRVYADGLVPDVREVAAEGLEPMYSDELIVGYERAISSTWTVTAHALARRFENLVEDISGEYALAEIEGIDLERSWWLLANPGRDVVAWVDSDGDGELERFHFTADDLGYPNPERKYYAVALSVRRRFADRWMAFLSYTWSHSYGNQEGYVESIYGCSHGGAGHLYDYPGLMDNSWGDLPNDRRHSFRAFGSYAFDMGLQLGGHLYYETGRPISGLGVHPTDEWSAIYGAASFYVQGEPAPRGSYGRTHDIWSLDLMLKYSTALGPGELNLRVDVFNVFNNADVTEVDEVGDVYIGAPNPDFLTPDHYQTPRRIRLGVGWVF